LNLDALALDVPLPAACDFEEGPPKAWGREFVRLLSAPFRKAGDVSRAPKRAAGKARSAVTGAHRVGRALPMGASPVPGKDRVLGLRFPGGS
jgi:hypothetical protein